MRVVISQMFWLVFFVAQAATAVCIYRTKTNSQLLFDNITQSGIQTSVRGCVKQCIDNPDCKTSVLYGNNTCVLGNGGRTHAWNATLITLTRICRVNFTSPSNLPPSAPSLVHLFRPVQKHRRNCFNFYAEGSSVVYNNWNGTRELCVRECAYDSRCNGVLYKLGTCVKASRIVQRDDEFRTNFEAWVRLNYATPYFNNRCSLHEEQSHCNVDEKCRWNQGLLGFNQFKIVFLGYCGRIKC